VLSMWLGRFDSHIIIANLFVSKKYYGIEILSFFIFSLKVNWTFITWVFFSILFNLRSIFFSDFIKFFHDNLSANFSRSPAGQNSFPSIRWSSMNNLFIYFWFLLTIYFMINIDLFSLSSISLLLVCGVAYNFFRSVLLQWWRRSIPSHFDNT
jgi:hypothetical protein